ncbi:MAG: ABC transporter permease [Desulfovibrio sp.]|jgi:putative ABC transport system permease protein|nr:ABC transporter permease [Desulfovibrio sp.]
MNAVLHTLDMAWRDYRHEALLSSCSVFVLAAVLAPLMVLLGVRHGVVQAMTERLLNDPRTLEVTPSGSGKYGPQWFRALSSLPETAFVVPQTRSIAATVNLSNPADKWSSSNPASLIATAAGDPLPARWGLPDVVLAAGYGEHGGGGPSDGGGTHTDAGGGKISGKGAVPVAGVILSESAARKAGLGEDAAGALLEGRVERVVEGRREDAAVTLRVEGVLPAEALGTDAVFVPLALLAAAEDYRDGRDAPFFVATGKARSGTAEKQGTFDIEAYVRATREERVYASFRLYARTLDDVSPLRQYFRDRGVDVYVRVAEIEAVRDLDRAFSVVFGLITGAALFGFTASTAGNALANVKRKRRSLGVMRLLGFPGRGILLFPVAQAALTAVLGAVAAYVLYLCVAFSIDLFFAGRISGAATVCALPPGQVLAVFGAVLLVSAAASLSAAYRAISIEPSEVIRDV